jgi:dienelactone hydrolase
MILTTLIAFSLAATDAAAPPFPTGRIVEKVACVSDATWSYALYLPSGYTSQRRWPVLLVFDPGARAVLGAELFREPAERFGWIVLSSADTRSSGVTMEHNAKAASAMLDDMGRRYAIDPRRVYAAGFSGGATLAWLVGHRPGQLAGVIASGGPFQRSVFPDHVTYDQFGATGTTDFNHRSMQSIDALLGERGAVHRLEVFDGPHSWMPPTMAADAVAWLEVQAMRRGLRERDDVVVAATYDADCAAARALEAGDQRLAAMRRWEAIAAGYPGLRDDAPARREASRLAALPEVDRERKDEEHWQSYEDGYVSAMFITLGQIEAGDSPPAAPRLAADLRLGDVERMAQRPGIEGVTGQRLLECVWSHLTLVLAPELLARRDYARLVPTLTLAVRIKPVAPVVLYNLACAHARCGSKGAALDALAKAVGAGFHDVALIEKDPDLDSVRGKKEYKQLIAALTSNAPPQTPAPARP